MSAWSSEVSRATESDDKVIRYSARKLEQIVVAQDRIERFSRRVTSSSSRSQSAACAWRKRVALTMRAEPTAGAFTAGSALEVEIALHQPLVDRSYSLSMTCTPMLHAA